MQFDDYVGTIDIDLSHMGRFLTKWFRPEDLVTVSGVTTSGIRKYLSWVLPVSRLQDVVNNNEDFTGMTTLGDQKMNLYVGTNPTKEDNAVTLFGSRGTKADVRDIYGCYVDLDVVKAGKKTGVFESKEAIFEFLKNFPLPPTIVVDNGVSGGVHAYWRLVDEDVPRATDLLLSQWWSYVAENSPVQVDRLIDITRVLRLPSGVYWPSNDKDKFDIVRVVSDDGPQYSLDYLLDISKEPFDKYQTKLAEIRTQKTRINVQLWNDRLEKRIKDQGLLGGVSSTDRLYSERQFKIVNQLLENYLENEVDWGDILEPQGWTQLKVSDNGEETWARPGKSDRSAVVNYVNSLGQVSGAMSLLSSSVETGLSDLKEAGIPITKMQVMLRYNYNDDIGLMVDDLYEKVVK